MCVCLCCHPHTNKQIGVFSVSHTHTHTDFIIVDVLYSQLDDPILIKSRFVNMSENFII